MVFNFTKRMSAGTLSPALTSHTSPGTWRAPKQENDAFNEQNSKWCSPFIKKHLQLTTHSAFGETFHCKGQGTTLAASIWPHRPPRKTVAVSDCNFFKESKASDVEDRYARSISAPNLNIPTCLPGLKVQPTLEKLEVHHSIDLKHL